MIRFLLLLLLLPGAELVANNTDAVESFASTTLGVQFIMTVTPKTMLRKPLPAFRGPANKTSLSHHPLLKDGKKQHSLLKDISVKSAKVQPVQGGTNISDTSPLRYQQKSSTPFESPLNSTKMPITVRSHSLSDTPQKRPVIRKGPTVPSKAKILPKFTVKNPSARYQSLVHLPKNVSSQPIPGQFKDSNSTASLTRLIPVPQRTATQRNTLKPVQKGTPLPPDRVKQIPVALQTVTQMGRQLKEKSSNSSVLLDTIVNQNSSFITNSLQHMTQSSNSTFTAGKESLLHELNSLNTQNHLLNSENVTSVPEANRHNDVSKDGLLRKVSLPGAHDSKVIQELKSKVNVRIQDRNVLTPTNLSSTDHSSHLQEDRVQISSDLTTQTGNIGLTQTDILAAQTTRTSDNVSLSNNISHGLAEAATEVQSPGMSGGTTQARSEKDQTQLGMTGGHQIHHNLTHSHKHRHLVQQLLNQSETNTISQHKGTTHDRTASSVPTRHHHKHQHNHTQPHSHHHKHRSDHHLHRNHVSHNLEHLTAEDFTTQLQQIQPQQLHTQLVTSTQRPISTPNYTPSSIGLLGPTYTGALQENETRSVTTEGSSAHPMLTTLDSQSELTTQSQEPTKHISVSVTDSQTAFSKLNNAEQSRQSEAYSTPHTKPFVHRHSGLHTNFTKTTTHHQPKQVTVRPLLNVELSTLDAKTTQNKLGSSYFQQELTMPTPEPQPLRNQPNQTFLGLEVDLTTQNHPKVTTQTLPHLGTHAHPEVSTEQDFSTRSVISTQKPTKPPLMTVTVAMPYVITHSQPEPTIKNVPYSRTVEYDPKPDPSMESDSKGNVPISANTKPSTNNALESTYQTKPTPKNLTTTYTPSPIQTEFNTKTKSIFSTMPDIEVISKSTNNAETIPQGDTESDYQTEPITKSASSTQKPTLVSKTYPNTKPQWVTDETDIQNWTRPTTNTHIESTTHTEPMMRTESTTQSESTTEQLIDFTNTVPIKSHGPQHETEKGLATTNKIESFTQTSIAIHSADKTNPAIQIETGKSNKTEFISNTSLKPTVVNHHIPTPHKGLMSSTQSDVGTPTYHQSVTQTGPVLTMNANEEVNRQTSRDQAVYTPTERTIFTNVTEQRTEGPAATTGRHHGYTHNGVHHSRPTAAWDAKAYHPTSRFPLGRNQDQATTVNNYKSPSSTKSVTLPQLSTFTPQTPSEMMSSPSGRDRIFIVDEQQPVFKVPSISVTYKVNIQHPAMCKDIETCKKRFSQEVTSAYKNTAGFDRADVINVTLAGTTLEYKVQFSVRVGNPMSMGQESVLSNPMSVFKTLAPSEYALLSAIHNTSLADMAEPCTEWFSCPRGFRCMPQHRLSAFCLSPCHGAFCQNDGICIHRKGQDPVCQCPVGKDFWYMGPSCDYRMTHHRLAAIACAVVFCIIICAAAAVFILVRRFQTQILQQKVAQTQSSYRRFSRFDDVPTHFWCPSQTWLTTSASINSLDNPAFSSSEEVFPLQALGSCVCGCQDGARNNTPSNPAQQPSRAPPRLETSCSSVNDLMVDSGKASDVSVCSWPMEPIHWTPFPILHQLSLQSPFHARRPHSYFEGMELVNTERSWTA